MAKLTPIVESIIREAEEQAEIDALNKAMETAFKDLGNLYKNKEAQIKQDIEQSDIELAEALDPISIIGIILALPKLTETIVKGLSKLVGTFKKLVGKGEGSGDPEGMAKLIIDGTHKWHKAYIKGLKWILKMSGVFDKAGIKGDAAQNKAAEVVYYTIIAIMAVYSGVGAAKAFKSFVSSGQIPDFNLSMFEALLTKVKTGEVQEFAGKLGLK